MILWIGDYKGDIAIRCLGIDGTPSRCMRLLKPFNAVSKVLRHNEGTTRRAGTSPTMGTGESKRCRDYGILGFSVGSTIGDPDKEPTELSNANCCVMAYDIECEFAGASKTDINSDLLCISLRCTCGFKHIVTRSKITGMDCKQSVETSNEGMAVQTMNLLIGHAPVFTVGHNVYEFDNTKIAKALPKNHPFRSYFQIVSKSDNKASTTMGLIMTIPGINNLDSYKYIYHSMYDRFKYFSLDYLSNILDLPLTKMDKIDIHFCKDWYSGSFVNSLTMAKYNMRDCEVTLELCNKLDIINQIMSLSHCANAWIRDVLLYNTGAMSVSSVCSNAWSKGFRYNWTRCDWIPNIFSGGHVLFTGKKVRKNVSIVDFTSMYPSLIRDGGISPECIDFIDISSMDVTRFDSITLVYTYQYDRSIEHLYIGIVGLGVSSGQGTDATGMVVIAEHLDTLKVSVDAQQSVVSQILTELEQDIKGADNTLSSLDVKTLWNSCNMLLPSDSVFDWYLDYSRRLCERCIGGSITYRYIFSPESSIFTSGMVDWTVGPLATTMMFATKEYIVRFPPGPRICLEACQTLMNTRRRYKELMRTSKDKNQLVMYDRLQYALKICANSMYGVTSFRHYNSYSPRCGISITGSSRWSLHVSAAVVCGLGFEVVYGDTDSVMYVISDSTDSSDLIYSYVSYLNKTHVDIELIDIMEFISGNENAIPSSDVYSVPACNVVLKVLNTVMSFTCFTGLVVEQQETKSTIPLNYKSTVFPSFMVVSKKHYVGLRRDGELYTKGMNYIRRSGSTLSSIVTEEFVTIALKYNNVSIVRLHLSRVCQEYKLKVKSGRYLQLLNINMKHMGKRSNYIRVKGCHGNEHEYVESTDIKASNIIDTTYYLNSIKDSLMKVTTALGIDFDPIYSGHAMSN